MEFTYPMSYEWSTNELIEVIQFYEAVEKAYESGVRREELMEKYRMFKKIVPSKAEEKTLCNELEECTGCSAYRTIEAAKKGTDGEVIKMTAQKKRK